jgi:hypothetical protein
MVDDLPQAEADLLFGLEKRRVSSEPVPLPDLGRKLSVELLSTDRRERYSLDINRSYISLSKLTLQNRARTTVILARLDIDGAPHRNPNDEELPCPHLHLYREGFGDKWAFLVPAQHFRDLSDRWLTLQDFMRFCHIVDPPEFDRGLFT